MMFIFPRGFVGSFKRLVMWCMAGLIALDYLERKEQQDVLG